MTYWRLMVRGLEHYWRTHLGVLLGAAVGAAVIVGALAVGDSIRASLARMAEARLGQVRLALVGNDRFFRDTLASRVSEIEGTSVAAVLQVRGMAARPDGTAFAGQVNVMGVDDVFWSFAPEATIGHLAGDEVIVNERLATQLNIGVGDIILLRVEDPGGLPRDFPLAPLSILTPVLRAKVRAVANDAAFGRFSLRADQVSPYNAFVLRRELQDRLKLKGRANLMLAGNGIDVERANTVLAQSWQLPDAEIELRLLPGGTQYDLSSRRVFIDALTSAAIADAGGRGILTYFVNELRLGDRAAPYSMVTAIEMGAVPEPIFPADFGDDEIVINRWLADDLHAAEGDRIELSYYVVSPSRQLSEASASFTVRRIVPIEGLAADRDLMPAFPGLTDAEHCREWDPGLPIDLKRVRPEDEQYWGQHRGTPKAFVTLAAGKHLWASRFGDLTAVRFDASGVSREQLEQRLHRLVQPQTIGLAFQDVRAAADRAAGTAVDFGRLFLALSFFLVAASLLLTGLLFVFGVEQRGRQLGVLLAVGWRPSRVKFLLMSEGAVLAIVGSTIGCVGGVLYAKVLLLALSTVWSGAVAHASVTFHVEPATLATGAASGAVLSVIAMFLTLGRLMRRPAWQLVASGVESRVMLGRQHRCWSAFGAGLFGITALVMLLVAPPATSRGAAGLFFGVGVMVLVASLCALNAVLSHCSLVSAGAHLTAARLCLGNVMRRRGRSSAVVVMVACSVFLLVAVGSFRRDASIETGSRSSGTGGFALVGQSSLPVLHDLNTTEGRDAFNISADDLPADSVVPVRVRAGDDASCLNLNRAQTPQLLGVDPQALHERGAFVFTGTIDDNAAGYGWRLLDPLPTAGEPIPAVADEATVVWALGRSLGDTIHYRDDHGRVVEVKIVGLLANSILQGNVIISERAFVRHFTNVSGHRMFLFDGAGAARDRLSRAFEEVGMELTSTAQRLAEFNAVQNTYLSIFEALGGLGMLLASVGLGAVVLRNVLERRGELALMRAAGFNRGQLRRLVFVEHGLLLAMGLVCGLVAARIAIIPALHNAEQAVSLPISLLATLAVLVTGMGWIWLATFVALRAPLLEAIRHE